MGPNTYLLVQAKKNLDWDYVDACIEFHNLLLLHLFFYSDIWVRHVEDCLCTKFFCFFCWFDMEWPTLFVALKLRNLFFVKDFSEFLIWWTINSYNPHFGIITIYQSATFFSKDTFLKFDMEFHSSLLFCFSGWTYCAYLKSYMANKHF